MVNKKTGERAVDRETGASMSTVGLLVSDEGEGNLSRSPSRRPVFPRAWRPVPRCG